MREQTMQLNYALKPSCTCIINCQFAKVNCTYAYQLVQKLAMYGTAMDINKRSGWYVTADRHLLQCMPMHGLLGWISPYPTQQPPHYKYNL